MHTAIHALKTLFILANIGIAINLIQTIELLAVLLVFLTLWATFDWVKKFASGKPAKQTPPPADKAIDVEALMSQGVSLWKHVESSVAQTKN